VWSNSLKWIYQHRQSLFTTHECKGDISRKRNKQDLKKNRISVAYTSTNFDQNRSTNSSLLLEITQARQADQQTNRLASQTASEQTGANCWKKTIAGRNNRTVRALSHRIELKGESMRKQAQKQNGIKP